MKVKRVNYVLELILSQTIAITGAMHEHHTQQDPA